MSALSGLGSKGEKKKGFQVSNINNIYKGAAPSTQKPTGTARQHGLQSLGKVGSARRMPPPPSLPSLKSENSGNDPNILLVPTGGAGWGSSKEKEKNTTAQTEPGGIAPPVSQPSLAGQTVTTKKPPTSQGQQYSQQSHKTTVESAIPTSVSSGGNGVAGGSTQQGGNNQPTGNIQQGGNSSGGGGGGVGQRSWSSVTTGRTKRDFFESNQSQSFQEEFPSLHSGGEEKFDQQKREDEKEHQYGPGPSLRPQNVASWREGGGRGAMQPQTPTSPEPSGGAPNGTGTDGIEQRAPESPPNQGGNGPQQQPPMMHHMGMRPGMPGPPGSRPPMGPMMGMRGPMMFPMYRGNFHGPHGGFYPGMRMPFGPFGPDQRVRGPAPHPAHRGVGGKDDSDFKRPAIIKDKDLKEFDEMINETDGGWASESADVDYSAPLVFNDDDEVEKSKHDDRNERDERDHTHVDRERNISNWDHDRSDRPSYDRQGSDRSDRSHPREAWGTGHGYRDAGRGPESSQDKDDEAWRQKRKEQKEDMAQAVQRARERREDEERRAEAERKRSCQEKLKKLDEKKATKPDSEDKDGNERSRTTSECSDERSSKKDETKSHGASQFSRQFAKNVPPRFQKAAQEQMLRQQQPSREPTTSAQQPTSPQSASSGAGLPAGQTHPMPMSGPPPGMRQPPHWQYGYPSMPPFMTGMPMHPPIRRGRSDSGSDSHDGDRRTPDIPQYDFRAWAQAQYGQMSGHWEEAMRRGHPGPHPFFGAAGYPDYPSAEQRRGGMEHMEKSIAYYEDDEEDDEDDKTPREADTAPSREASHPIRRETSKTSPENKAFDEKSPLVQSDPFDDSAPIHHEHKDKGRKRDYREEGKGGRSKDRHDSKHDDKILNRSDSHEDKLSHKRDEIRNQKRDKDRGDQSSSTTDWGRAERLSNEKFHKRGSRDGYGGSYGPRPITAQQAQDNIAPAKSRYTSLKRSHSGGAPSVKGEKDGSPSSKSLSDKDKIEKGPSKEDAKPIDKSVKAIQEEDVWNDGEESTKRNDTDSRSHQQNDRNERHRDREDRDKQKDRRDIREGKGRGKGTNDRPPSKKTRETRDDDRHRRDDRQQSSRGRGRGSSREFVRGGRVSRGRSAYSSRGGASSRGRGSAPSVGREEAPPVQNAWFSGERTFAKLSKEDDDPNEARRRAKDEESDISQDELSHTASEGSSDKHGAKDKSKDAISAQKVHEPPNQADFRKWPDVIEAKNLDQASGESWADQKANDDSKIGNWSDDNNFGKWQNKIQDGEGREKRKDDRRKDDRKRDDRRYGDDDRRGRGGRGRGGRRSENRDDRQYDGGEDRRHKHERDRSDKDRGSNSKSFSSRGRGRGGSRGRGGDRSERGNERGERGGRNYSAPARNIQSQPQQPKNGELSPGEEAGLMAQDLDHQPLGQRRGQNEWNSNPPPRFSSMGRGRGERRGGRKGRGGTREANRSVTKQNSVDVANDEWETASESSDLQERQQSKNELDKQGSRAKEKREVKKSFSSQRPASDRSSQRGSSTDNRNSLERASKHPPKENSQPVTANGTARNSGNKNNKTMVNMNKKENVVYRVDGVVHKDPTAIQNAINNLNNKSAVKKSELSDVSKPLKTDREKKDALANIDINNYASVVVIDDQPEVSIDDPAFLFENNEGFQEVTSKKTQKAQIKLKVVEDTKQTQPPEAKKKKEEGRPSKSKKSNNVLTKDAKRLSKLPPRFAKAREQMEREKKENKRTPINVQGQNDVNPAGFMKFEKWDNELANNIPVSSQNSNQNAPPSQPSHQTNLAQPKNHSTPFSLGMPMPAPTPIVNAWEKPINLSGSSTPGPNIVMGVNASSKFDKNEQHDSGIDISETQNSASSSTRSSPSADNKGKGFVDRNSKRDKVKARNFEQPKQQRVQRRHEKQLSNKPIDERAMKIQAAQKVELPPSFKEQFGKFKGEDSADIKLDFTFDAELAKLTEETKEENDRHVKEESSGNSTSGLSEPPKPIPLPNGHQPTSPSTDDLNQKIASVKNVWENMPSMPTVFEHANVSVANMTESDVKISNAQYSTFSGMENVGSQEYTGEGSIESGSVKALDLESSATDHELRSSAGLSASQGINYSSVSSLVNNVATSGGLGGSNLHLEQPSNVCKVKPQQQTQSIPSPQVKPPVTNSNTIEEVNKLPNLTANNLLDSIQASSPGDNTMLHNNLAGIGSSISSAGMSSPPAQVILAQMSSFAPFQLGSTQLLPQEPARYQTYSYSLSQQPAAQIGQTYATTQASLFLPSAGAAPSAAPLADLYGTSSQIPAYRNQFPTVSQPQQNTIMVSSTSSSLMSASIKPPSAQNQYMSASSQKNNPLLQYGQIMNSGPSLQASQMYLSYDPSQSVNAGQTNAPSGGASSQGLGTSQIITGSQLLTQRAPVQNLPNIQQQSSFYSGSTQNLQQTGFYAAQQQSTPNLQTGPMQPPTTPTQYFSGQQGLAHPLQQHTSLSQPNQVNMSLGTQSTLNKSAAPFKPASQQVSSQQSLMPNQIKSPTQSSAFGFQSTSGLSPNTKAYQSQVSSQQQSFGQNNFGQQQHQFNQSMIPNMNQPPTAQYGNTNDFNKMMPTADQSNIYSPQQTHNQHSSSASSQYAGQHIQQPAHPTGSYVAAQQNVMIGMHPTNVQSSQRFNAPIQRPAIRPPMNNQPVSKPTGIHPPFSQPSTTSTSSYKPKVSASGPNSGGTSIFNNKANSTFNKPPSGPPFFSNPQSNFNNKSTNQFSKMNQASNFRQPASTSSGVFSKGGNMNRPSVPPPTNSGPAGLTKEQQAKQREALLKATKDFLNPTKSSATSGSKTVTKTSTNVAASSSGSKPSVCSGNSNKTPSSTVPATVVPTVDTKAAQAALQAGLNVSTGKDTKAE